MEIVRNLLVRFSLVSNLLQEELVLNSLGKDRDAYWTTFPYLDICAFTDIEKCRGKMSPNVWD